MKILTDQIKILGYLGNNYKYGYYLLILSNFFIGFLEALSVAAIVPLIGILLHTSDNYFFFNFENIFEIQNNELLTLSIIFSIFLIKNIVVGIYFFIQVKYSFKVQYRIGNVLFENFILKKFTDIKKINISQVLRVINTDSILVVTGYILPALQIFTELIILVSYIIFVIIFQPKGIIVFFMMFFSGLIIYRLFKKHLNDLGSKRLQFEKIKIQNVNESFKLFREIKVFLKEKYFINRFIRSNKNFNNVIAGLHYIQILPRVFIETLGILSILLFIYFLLITGENNSDIITVLAVYVAVMARSLPSVNRITTALQSLKFNSRTLEELSLLFKRGKKISYLSSIQDLQIVKTSIEAKDLSFSYYDEINEKKIFEKINFKAKKGELLLVRGKSGSGKTSLCNILLGLDKQSSGEIIIDGEQNTKKFFASFKLDIIGLPLMLKLVFNIKGQLVNLKNSFIRL